MNERGKIWQIPNEAISVSPNFLTEKLNKDGSLGELEPISWICLQGNEIRIFRPTNSVPGEYSCEVYDPATMKLINKEKGKYIAPLNTGINQYRINGITCSTMVERTQGELEEALEQIESFHRPSN